MSIGKAIVTIASGVVRRYTGTHFRIQETGDPVKSTLIITFKDGKESILGDQSFIEKRPQMFDSRCSMD